MATILVVDDEKNILDVLNEGLTTAGYKVITADSGVSALKIVDSQAFELLITDIVMPDMDGLELIRYVKMKMPAVKVMAISAGGQLADSDMYLESAENLGADIRLNKPFDLDEIISEVDKLLKTE